MHTVRLVCKLRTIDIIAACRFRSPPLTTSSSSRVPMRMPALSCRRMGMRLSGPTDTRAGLTLRKTSRANTASLCPTTRDHSPSFLSLPGQTRPTRRSMVRGIPMPTTTSFTAWPRCVGVGSRGQFSALRPSARITCAATHTRTTRRCGARLDPSDSANVERSRSPTARSASPTTGSKNHHALVPRGRNAKSAADTSHTLSHAIPREHRSPTRQKPHDFNVSKSTPEVPSRELHVTFPVPYTGTPVKAAHDATHRRMADIRPQSRLFLSGVAPLSAALHWVVSSALPRYLVQCRAI